MPDTTVFLDNLPDSPEINELHAYWMNICGDRSVPDRQDFSPVAIKKHLANIAIVEVDIAAEAFEVRLFGTALMDLFGEDRTGRTQKNLTDKYSEKSIEDTAIQRWQELLTKTVQERKPVFFQSPRMRAGYHHQSLKGICLPLTNGKAEITQVLAFVQVR